MRANILFCLYFFMGLAVQLQAQVTVTGKVIDEQQQPVPYANIVLLSLPDSAFVAGSISNEEGAFSLNVKETKDVLRISSIGYATVYRPLDNRSTDLGIICLASDTQILAEVVVKADMPVTRMRGDALVTNIQNSVLSKAGSASDVLGKVPGVIKERNSYEVLGKGTPLIYINGRQVRDDSELDQLNSEDIKSVEVVTNPGARYDATVTAVIRIQTIRRAGDGFGFDLRSSYYQSQNVDLIEQLNVNYRHNGLDIFGIFRYLKNEYIMKNDIVHTLESDSLWKYQNLLDGTVVDKSLRGEIGANYSLNDKHSLGFRYTLTSRPNTKSDVFTSNDITANNQFYDHLENQEYSSTSGKPTHQLNVYYNGTVGDLNIDFNTDYYTNTSTGKGLYHEVSQEQESRDVHTQSYIRNKLLASKLVLSYPLFGGNLSVGGEYTDTRRNDEYRNPEKYVELFAEKFGVPVLGRDANMISASAEGMTIINFGMGSPNAAIIMDLLGAIQPKACLFLGKCGGIDKKNKLGDLILPIAAIRGEGTSNDYYPPEVPALPAFMLQRAVSSAIRDHARDYWTGTVYTTNRRIWEHDEEFKKYLLKTRAMCVDMETATLFTTGFYNHIPTGALLLVSDQPMIPEGVKTDKSDNIVTQQFVKEHVEIGIASMRMIIDEKKTVKHLKFDW